MTESSCSVEIRSLDGLEDDQRIWSISIMTGERFERRNASVSLLDESTRGLPLGLVKAQLRLSQEGSHYFTFQAIAVDCKDKTFTYSIVHRRHRIIFGNIQV
jgi:hypothetical protein